MLDRKFVLENQDLMRENIKNRQMNVDFDKFLQLEEQRKSMQAEMENLRAESNSIAKNKDTSIEGRRKFGKWLKEQIADINKKLKPVETESNTIFSQIPNLTYEGSPIGEEKNSTDIARGKTEISKFDFTPKDHIELMESLDMLNLKAAANVAGSGFYYFTGAGALLEMAMMRFALDHIMKQNYTPVITPDVARDAIMQGTGFVPRGDESNTYRLAGQDLNLIATSEITLMGMFQNEILDAKKFPIKLAGTSHCFRSERAHGSATRGIYRVHQFSKTEMVVICTPQQGEEIHMEMRRLEQEIFDALEIPYRVLEVATGDLGAMAYRKFDLEAWMPGRNGGTWGEITSTSNCLDFQARRLKIRYKNAEGKSQFAHTLNGTALSVCRAMIALVENHQQPDGSIKIPKVLVPYMNNQTVISK